MVCVCVWCVYGCVCGCVCGCGCVGMCICVEGGVCVQSDEIVT